MRPGCCAAAGNHTLRHRGNLIVVTQVRRSRAPGVANDRSRKTVVVLEPGFQVQRMGCTTNRWPIDESAQCRPDGY